MIDQCWVKDIQEEVKHTSKTNREGGTQGWMQMTVNIGLWWKFKKNWYELYKEFYFKILL